MRGRAGSESELGTRPGRGESASAYPGCRKPRRRRAPPTLTALGPPISRGSQSARRWAAGAAPRAPCSEGRPYLRVGRTREGARAWDRPPTGLDRGARKQIGVQLAHTQIFSYKLVVQLRSTHLTITVSYQCNRKMTIKLQFQ